MGNCSRCGHALNEGSLFCDRCGAKAGPDAQVQERRAFPKKIVLYGGIAAAAVIAVLAVAFAWSGDPVKTFMSAIESNEYVEAGQIYEEDIQGNTAREKEAETSLKAYIDETRENFVSGKTDYNAATTALETIAKTTLLAAEVQEARAAVDRLNDSRIAFRTGEEFLANDNVKEAIESFKQVIEEDRNYGAAQDLIASSTGAFKTAVLEEAEAFAAQEQFQEAMNALDGGLEVVGDDADLKAKRAVYEKQNEEKIAAERKKNMEEAKANQEITVERAGILVQSDDFKALYPDMMQAIVRNHTQKTVKNLEISMLAYDANGLPVMIQGQFDFGAAYEYVGLAENANIPPNSTYGEDVGWNLADPHGIAALTACVRKAEYCDGTAWENPYYAYWLEEYKEKPQQGPQGIMTQI